MCWIWLVNNSFRMSLYCVAVLFSLLALTHASDVLDYSGSDFEERIKEHDTALVEFFAPWCGHCKRLAPEYEKAATALKQNDPPVPLVKVDCTSDYGKETCNKYGVSGYPTLKIFRQGEFSSEYNGPRESGGIIKYMKSQVGPSSREVEAVDSAEKILDKGEVVVFGFFKDQGSKLKEEFLKLADKLRETFTFAHTFSSDVIEKFGSEDKIVLFQPKHLHSKFEDNKFLYEGSADKYELEQFIREKYHGLVGHRTQENYQQFKNPLVVAYFNVDYVKNVKGTNYWRNRIMKVAQNYKDKVNFAISNKESFAAEMDEFGLKSQGDKPVVGARNEKQQKFRMTDEFSIENFEKFLKDFTAGNLKPYMKSEAVPETNDGPVKVAVAENFDDVVIKPDKDVLIEFYAPWCGHCKKLAPTYEEVGKTFQDEDVEIVKMDAVANDVPAPFEVHGFPTLYWVPKDNKDNPRKYEGGRELDDFIKYIAKHSTDELKGFDRKGNKKKTEL